MPITQKTTLAQMIHDFVHSDDPKFANDSSEQRRKRAIGAWYGMHKESVNEILDPAQPMQMSKRKEAGYVKQIKARLLGKTVTDKKTGEKYDPDEKFNDLLNHPDTKAQFARMKAEKGRGWPKSAAHESIDESKMAELDAAIKTHVEPHIKAYKAGEIDADTLGDRVTTAHKKISSELGHPIDVIKSLVNDHVDSRLSESIMSFEDWLIESKELDSDSRGKLHELLTAAHLNHMIHGKLAHAEHFRDVKGRTPHEAHDELIAGLSKADYQKAHSHARQAAEEIHKHIQTHHPEVLSNKNHHVKVSWTSLKSDHEKLTGKVDEAHSGGADVMVSSHDDSGECHHAVGYSLKIASNKITTGQSGSKTTENVLRMKPGSLSKHDTAHRNNVAEILKKHGHDADNMSEAQKHAVFKTSRDHPQERGRQLAAEIRDSAYKSAAAKVGEIKKHLTSHGEDEQKASLREFISPTHTHPTYQVSTNPEKNTTIVKNEAEETAEKYKKAGKLSYQQSEGHGNSLLVKSAEGKTLHRLEVRSKRPVGHSEILVK